MPVTNVRSEWSSGNLVFFEKAVGRSTTGDILTIGTSMVSVGGSAQDIDFKVWMGAADQYVLFDAGAAKVTFAKVDVEIDGDLTIDLEDIQLGDNQYLQFGDATGGDVYASWVSASSLLQILPAVDDTGAINIGNGTKDIDFKVFLGTDAKYVDFNVGDSNVVLSAGVSLSIDDTTDSESTVTGSLHTDGGLGVAKALYVGGLANITGAVTLASTLGMANNMAFTIGTTTATAETKMTLEFDETTTGVSQILVGSLSVPQVLNENPGSAVVVDTMNILHSAGDGDCDDLIGRYTKVAVAGDGDSGLTVVGTAQRLYVGTADDDSAAQEAYAIQPWAKHSGTGTLLAMSGVSAALILNDGDAFEATNSINAGHFHIKTASGAANGAVTSSNFDGVMIEVYGNVTGLQSGLHIAAGAAVGAGIRLTGTANLTNLIDLDSASGCVAAAGTASGSWGNADAVATKVLAMDIDGTAYYIPIHTANAS